MPINTYLSSSIVNSALNLALRQYLPADRFNLILPQEFADEDISRSHFPRYIYERCIREMERCDVALLLLDAFGVDCASEAGWLSARNKPLIGIAAASCYFLQHWMVKGNLSGVICMTPVIFDEVIRDPILKDTKVILCESQDRLADAITTILHALEPAVFSNNHQTLTP